MYLEGSAPFSEHLSGCVYCDCSCIVSCCVLIPEVNLVVSKEQEKVEHEWARTFLAASPKEITIVSGNARSSGFQRCYCEQVLGN